MKKIICSLLSICLAFIFVGQPVMAEGELDIESVELNNKSELSLQEQINELSGDAVITLTKNFYDSSALIVPETLDSLTIEQNGFSLSMKIFANGVPLTLRNGKVWTVFGGGYNQSVDSTSLTLENVRVNSDIHGGGYSDSASTPANVLGSSTVVATDSVFAEEMPNHEGVGNSGSLFGGGFGENGGIANVGETSVIINGGVLYSVSGGGHGTSGTANVDGQSYLDISDIVGYGDIIGCGYAEDDNTSTTCGSVDLRVNQIYLPSSQGAFRFQSCDIYGGSMSYDTDPNIRGEVYGNVNLEIVDAKTYGYIIGGGGSNGLGSFSVGSINLSVKGVKDYYEERVEEVLRNQLILFEGLDEECHGDINVVIEDSQTDSIYTSIRNAELSNNISLRIKSAMELSELQGISELILEEPLTVVDGIYLNKGESINVILENSWNKDMHAISIPVYRPNISNYFIGDNIEFGVDKAG